ncbi:MAG: acylphosphatase [Candidatus Magasanikbacteria bacterium]
MIHYDIKIFGKVQGVGFRFNTKRTADKLGVSGFVKNKEDGSVYTEVEGEPEKVDKFIEWCKEGPSFARVKRIEKEEGGIQDYEDFEIRY